MWVAGPAARERYRLADIGVDDRDVVEVGRPQLAPVRAVHRAACARRPYRRAVRTHLGGLDRRSGQHVPAAGGGADRPRPPRRPRSAAALQAAPDDGFGRPGREGGRQPYPCADRGGERTVPVNRRPGACHGGGRRGASAPCCRTGGALRARRPPQRGRGGTDAPSARAHATVRGGRPRSRRDVGGVLTGGRPRPGSIWCSPARGRASTPV